MRDEQWKKLMADPRMQPEANPMPFDGKRLIYGGFEIVVKAGSASFPADGAGSPAANIADDAM